MTEHAKGTPGPWHVDADGMSIVDEDGMVVAEVQFPFDGDREGIRASELDARCIAAVPQMEAALEAMLAADHADHLTWLAAREQAKDALAAARGEVRS